MPLDADYLSSYRLTHAQAAALLGVHPITVSTWVSQGKLPSWRVTPGRTCSDPTSRRWPPHGEHGEPGWVMISGAAELLGVTRAWVTYLAQRDLLPYERTARHWEDS
jgi:excisionase family DNA binding protein